MISGTLRVLEWGLWTLGLTSLGYCGFIAWEGAWGQIDGQRELVSVHPVEHSVAHPVRLAPGSVVGRLEIPRLELSVVVFEGTDSDELNRGVGHLSGSALPSSAGNVVVAGHRDTFFRGLRRGRIGD